MVCPAEGLYQYAEFIEGFIYFLSEFFLSPPPPEIEFFTVNGWSRLNDSLASLHLPEEP